MLSVVNDVVLRPQRPDASTATGKKKEKGEKKSRLDSKDCGLATWSVIKKTSDII